LSYGSAAAFLHDVLGIDAGMEPFPQLLIIPDAGNPLELLLLLLYQ
jgi:hypothetical protein